MAVKKFKHIEEAWLGLDDVESTLLNPMSMLRASEDDFNLRLAWLMIQPEYLSFMTSHILNIQLLPSQALVLQELWTRKFPMLIASRGFGKSFMLSLYAVLRALILPRRKKFCRCCAYMLVLLSIWRHEGTAMLRDRRGQAIPDTDRCTQIK